MTPINPITARLYVRLMAEEALRAEIDDNIPMGERWTDGHNFEDYTITITVERKQDDDKLFPSPAET